MYQRRILGVDDDPETIVLSVEVLEAAGYPVTVAPNGQVALAHAVDTPFAAILLGEQLSDDGVDRCPQLRASLASSVPIILVTAAGCPPRVEPTATGAAATLLHNPVDLRPFCRSCPASRPSHLSTRGRAGSGQSDAPYSEGTPAEGRVLASDNQRKAQQNVFGFVVVLNRSGAS
jgi:CheY-like chemotaxis protein